MWYEETKRPMDEKTKRLQNFVYLGCRLGYLADGDAAKLTAQSRQTFGGLHGLIKAVEKEAGTVAKVVATLTSLIVLCAARLSLTAIGGSQ